jgi:NADP-dependent 3-hydroxy acid dehydrogenase YdfG
MKLLPGSLAVVTGAASGIGLELSHQLAGRGLRVVMADVEESTLEAEARRCGAEAVPVDVRDPDALARLADRLQEAQLVCSNAGVVAPRAPVWLSADGDCSWVLDVNVRGTLNTIRAFVPAMISRDAGHLLVTGSFTGLCPAPNLGIYAASKHAITGLTTTLRDELRALGSQVGVTLAAPGGVISGLRDASRNRPLSYGASTVAPAVEPPRRPLPRIPAGKAAAQLLAAVERDQFLVITDPQAAAVVEDHLAQLGRDVATSVVNTVVNTVVNSAETEPRP